MQMDPTSMVGQFLDNGNLLVTQVIGSGSFATVYLAESTSRPIRNYAVKSLFKPGLTPNQLALQQLELSFIKLVSPHPNIVTLHSALQDDKFLHLVMEFAPNDLFDFIADMETMDDALIKDTFSQIVSAVKHCHKLNVYHRDLKPENILIVPVSTTAYSAKITDFGLATQDVTSKEFGCGSIRYLAPECLPNSSARSYSPAKADIWALGIILVNLISGKNPWRRADNSDECFNCYKNDGQFWQAFGVAKPAQSLVSDILCIDPKRRITLEEIERRLEGITVFRDMNGMRDMGERESTLGTVVMEREHRSWNSWTSEMSFGKPLIFGDAVVPEEMRIKSPSFSFEETFEDYDYQDDDDDMMIFPPMDDENEELFAQVIVRGEVPSFVKTGQQETEPKKKRGKSKKRKPKAENEAADNEPHDNSETTSQTITNSVKIEDFNDVDSATTPIAIPRVRNNMFDGDKTPTGRNEVATMTEEDDDSPPRWRKTLAPPRFDKHTHTPLGGRSASLTPPGSTINARNSPSNPFRISDKHDNDSPSRKVFDGSSSRRTQLTPTASRLAHGLSPKTSSASLNRNSAITPVLRVTREESPSGGNLSARRSSPPSTFSPGRTPRKQDYQHAGDHTPPGRDEFLKTSGYRNQVTPTTRFSEHIRRSESGTRPTISNRPSTHLTPHYGSRTSFSGNRPTNHVKPPTTPSRSDVKQLSSFHVSPGSTHKTYLDDHKWTKYTTSFGKGVGTRTHKDEWKKVEEWQPFGGLMEFGWDKHAKREAGRREWKRREVL